MQAHTSASWYLGCASSHWLVRFHIHSILRCIYTTTKSAIFRFALYLISKPNGDSKRTFSAKDHTPLVSTLVG